jgi:hypothetical protein
MNPQPICRLATHHPMTEGVQVIEVEEIADPGKQELHADADQQETEDAGHGVDSAGSQEQDHPAGRSQHREAKQESDPHSEQHGDIDQVPIPGRMLWIWAAAPRTTAIDPGPARPGMAIGVNAMSCSCAPVVRQRVGQETACESRHVK